MNIDNLIYRIRENVAGKELNPPASDITLSAAEQRIGFSLPPLLRSIYSDLSDGGIGPGYGLLPLFPLAGTENEDSVVELYEIFHSDDIDEPKWKWQERLLPILDWGCAIRSCIDCSKPELPVVRFDPNEGEKDFFPEAPSFEIWLEDWLSGKDLWRLK